MPDGGVVLTGDGLGYSIILRTDSEGTPIWSRPVTDIRTSIWGQFGDESEAIIDPHFSYFDPRGRLTFFGNSSSVMATYGPIYFLVVDESTGNALDTITGIFDSTTTVETFDPVGQLRSGGFVAARMWSSSSLPGIKGGVSISLITSRGRSSTWLGCHTVDTAIEGGIYHRSKAIVETRDGNIVVWGQWGPFNNPNTLPHLFLMSLDTTGQLLWLRRPGEIVDNLGTAIHLDTTTDGGFIGVSAVPWRNTTTDARWQEIFVYKFDANGRTEWERQFSNDLVLWPYSVRQTADGGFVVSGSTGQFDSTYRTYLDSTQDLITIKLDREGEQEWWKEWGTPGIIDRIKSTVVLSDGSLMLTGRVGTKAYLARMSIGTASVGRDRTAQNVSAVPNPARDVVRLTTPTTGSLDATALRLYDALGRQVAAPYTVERAGVVVDVSTLSSGTYRAVITDETTKRIGTTSFVVTR